MAIIFPQNCRGITLGALREIKKNGITHASGGFCSDEVIKAFEPNFYFHRREPAGAYMQSLEQTKQTIDDNTDAIRNSSKHLVEAAVDANKQMQHVSGKFREGTEKLGVAIDKFMKIASRGDFAETVKLTESFVDSMERLAILEEKGLLDKVMKAMKG